MRAPVPAALPALCTFERSQSGISPRIIAYLTSMWLPKAPASLILPTCSMPSLSISSRDAGIKRGLAKLDGAHVILRDADQRLVAALAAARIT